MIRKILFAAFLLGFTALPYLSRGNAERICRAEPNANLPISIDAEELGTVSEFLPIYEGELQKWQELNCDDLFLSFDLREETKEPEKINLENGYALLFNSETYESMVFSSDADNSWCYMNGRAEECYNKMMEGEYAAWTLNGVELRETNLLSELDESLMFLSDALKKIGIEMGEPIQATVYFPATDEVDGTEMPEAECVEIAFFRKLEGVNMVPWGYKNQYHHFSPHTYITVYIDYKGVSYVLVPCIFDDVSERDCTAVLNEEQAIQCFYQFMSETIYPEGYHLVIDHISLEYYACVGRDDYSEIQLLPVWCFYSEYLNDDERRCFLLEAYSGEPVV